MEKGVVYLVGAGPGDPGLITVHGRQRLMEADVVLYDRLADARLLEFVPEHCELIDVGKRPQSERWEQGDINRALVQQAEAGKCVVRLKGGDPFVFGRGGEEAAFLREAGIMFEIVPGISSALAVPAYAGIPVTHREYNASFAVVAGHEDPDKDETAVRWEHLAKGPETLVILMGVKNLSIICERLLQYGRSPSTPIALIRWGTRSNQATLTGTLADIVERVEEAAFRSPAVIVVGEVVKERKRLAWIENKPLFGQRILVPHTQSQENNLVQQIHEKGGEAIEVPVAQWMPTISLESQLRHVPIPRWVLFSHRQGVEAFFSTIGKIGGDIRQWAVCGFIAWGEQTAQAMRERGVQADVIVDSMSSFVQLMESSVEKEMDLLVIRDPFFPKGDMEELRRIGYRVSDIQAYTSRKIAGQFKGGLQQLKEGAVDWIAFTDASMVNHFCDRMDEAWSDWMSVCRDIPVACIGPKTATAAKERQLCTRVFPDPHTVEGMIAGMQAMRNMKDPNVKMGEGLIANDR
ncbi:uroporphyrinogen-III C-methyltransferase [Marininema halotolerans]|uniref:Uroporphyrinogen-III C-methyltransferase n=1 Tax=Marininema halotolerans TaxID=1155944 RepID=A0A1I6QLI8_9BACL|nr:uroporphyrinogen-III C-methyltransferase [Marininema halotolerans]SFS53260.1 uroporphyrinogen III methyltransferase / synthase [Marininema halotolerans]